MFSWLAYNTLCALPLALLALCARRVLRARPALEHLLWLLVLARLVLPPFGTGAAQPGGAYGAAGIQIVIAGEPTLGDEIVSELTRVFGRNWSTWVTGILLVLFTLALAWVVGRELLRARAVEHCVRSARAAGSELEEHVCDLARRLGVRAPRVRVSPVAASPFLWSLRRPVLVLPESQSLPEPTVLAHELAHLRRRDHWTAWLELVVQGFHFWNPLFWLARARLHHAAELASDRWVLERFPARRRAFASALIDTAERASVAFVPRAVQAIGADRRGFEERLTRILRAETRVRGGRGLLAAGFALACLTLPGLAAPTLAEFRSSLPALPDGMDREAWETQLDTAEGRLSAEPESGDALSHRGIALLALGRPEEALAVMQRQEAIGFKVPKALYNQACVYVRLDRPEEALACLLRAADLGLDVAASARIDPDLAALREHPDFVALFGD